MSNVEKRDSGTPSWFDLMTPDLDGAKKFYGELFGWTFLTGPAEMGYYTMCQRRGLNAAGMGKRPDDAPYPSMWSVYFDTTDSEASANRVRELGGMVTMGPMDVADAGRMTICMDPTGAMFGFWQAGQHKGAQIADEPGAMTWTEVCTRDGEKARDFYAKVLDLEPHKMEGMDYWTLHRGEKAHGGVMHMGEKFPKEIPAHWAAYFAVEDADKACEQIKALGGSLKQPPFDTPYGRIAIAADPYGAVFSIIKLAAH